MVTKERATTKKKALPAGVRMAKSGRYEKRFTFERCEVFRLWEVYQGSYTEGNGKKGGDTGGHIHPKRQYHACTVF